jgi:hypothetical protein
MKQRILYYFVLLTLLVGITACNNDDLKNDDDLEKTTYMGLSLFFPGESGLKAEPEDYNPKGYYAGNTVIETVDIYLLSGDGSTLLDRGRYGIGDFGFRQEAGVDMMRLNTPFKTTPGNKQMIVIVNSPEALSTTIPSDTYRYTLTSGGGSLSLSDLADVSTDPISVDPSSGAYGDMLVLSGKTTTAFTIADDVSSQEVISNGNNVAHVDVTRVPSRAIVTSTAPAAVGTLGTISDVTYSVAQGANSVYLFPQKTSGAISTWGYAYVPASSDYQTTATQYYDYSDLNNASPVPSKPVEAGKEITLPGKFLLENTHISGAAGTSQYRKGNTAYVLVRAKFTPSATKDGGALNASGTFYVGGTDGYIYSSVETATNPLTGTQYQSVAEYTGGKVLYFVWLNPDNITKPVNSPVIRNNIYHININSFKSIGLNWNPLVPPGVTNPDPKPVNPTEPTNPVDPEEPLSSSDTYMSVDIAVLRWVVHSYDIDL